jgi:hypothetical protein
MVVDAATEEVVGFYQRYGFQCIREGSLRLFLPARSLVT